MELYFIICLYILSLTFSNILKCISTLKELKKQTIEVKTIIENHELEEAFVNDEPQTPEEYIDELVGFDYSEGINNRY